MPIAPTPIPEITGPIPLTSDPMNFDPRADAAWTDLVAAIPAMNEENEKVYANALEVNDKAAEIAGAAAVATDAAGLRASSNSTLTVGAGTKTVVFTSSKPNLAVLNKRVVIVQLSDPSIKMFGSITGVASSSQVTVTVVSSGVFGAGTYSQWQVLDAAFFASGATAADLRAGTTEAAAVTPKALRDADLPETLAWASTVTPSLLDGWHRRMSASASFTLGAPTNCWPGQMIVLDVLNTNSGVVLAVNAAWDRAGGLLGVLDPGNGARNKIVGFIDEVDGSGTMTRGTYNVVRGLA